MGKITISSTLYYMYHYDELKSMVQWSTWHQPVHERNEAQETESLRVCFELLDQTSRSFSTVIKELHPELLVPVALFYLILRGQDTIEDDMTVSIATKEPMLREFYTIIEQEGWNFDGNGPLEKDRAVLVKFNNITEEFRKVKPAYRTIIKDITRKMGNGMADYANNAEHNTNGVNSVKDYDLYCHYVAGLVGEGLTRLFVTSELANPVLLDRPQLQESMGLFLQKVNIIRDVHEDFVDKRRFWPKEIWSKHVTNFEDLFEPENIVAATNCCSEMVLNALWHIDKCLFYLAGLKEQSVFNFAAIPQTMAIATLGCVFRNPKIFKQNIKITKGQACQIMIDSTQNLRLVCEVFRTYVRKIHQKNTTKDPNYLSISIACAKVEQFIETIYPSQNPEALIEKLSTREAVKESSLKAVKEAIKDTKPLAPPRELTAEEKRVQIEAKWDNIYMLIAVIIILFLLSIMMILFAHLLGARVDIAFNELTKGRFSRPGISTADGIRQKYDHGEL